MAAWDSAPGLSTGCSHQRSCRRDQWSVELTWTQASDDQMNVPQPTILYSMACRRLRATIYRR
jgi:hypothetical protein